MDHYDYDVLTGARAPMYRAESAGTRSRGSERQPLDESGAGIPQRADLGELTGDRHDV
ncbi:hypothetical protein [Burkholderia stabilis]|uniref:hypothetical protein n=1 Tax=Burkholderia stabilis TaxID=95485 RepID=UPI00158EED0B|nr:hypothetical protein [Burkholderia stabilis]HDR9489181.1 hypothetical protein [Burkholderia stabilis]HDR9522754.1 hypothetical protein [Burkholderia stabilis]HDR9530012.1 hypothetical protein [Burkholderia stabilis]HDR9535339.1 hypothetical protein [Burkholderia stabilis]HDR9544883.1 hypothetical protein [Burkholderia stabilis]